MKLPFCETCQTIHSKGEPCASAPLNLCPPTGITGTTLADLPDRRTVWEMRVDGSFLRWCGTLEQFRKDCEEYCDRSKGHWEKVTNTEFRFISPEEPKITHFKAVKKGVDSVVESSATLPASPVKDTPETCPDCGYPFTAGYHMPGEPCPVFLKSPASPVESVGVPHYTPYSLDGSFLVDCDGMTLADLTPSGPYPFWKDKAAFIRDACNAHASHAAKDAKIRALETVARDQAMLAADIACACQDIRKGLRDEAMLTGLQEKAVRFNDAARAALALPCAPLGS